MHRVFAILSLALVLIAPGLCRGGMLMHPCDDDHTRSSTNDKHNEKDGGCGHEDGCAMDPCSLAVRTTPPTRVSTELHDDGFSSTPVMCLPASILLTPPDSAAILATAAPPFELNSPQYQRCPLLLI